MESTHKTRYKHLQHFNTLDRLTDEAFQKWYAESWKKKNRYNSLSATPENRERGAYLEWRYLQNGAVENPADYTDIFVDGVSVDCKMLHVKTTRPRLFSKVHDGLIGRVPFFQDKGIEEAHVWADSVRSTIATPWFRFIVETEEVIYW